MAVNELEVYKDFKALLKKSDIPSTKDVGVILAALIKNVSVALAQSRTDMADKVKDWERIGSNIKSELADAKKQMGALVADTNKQTTNEWYKALNNAVYALEKTIKEIKPYDSASLENQWTTVIHEINAKLDAIKPYLLLARNVRDTLEALDGEERLDVSAIKGVDELIEKAVGKVKTKGGASGYGGVSNAREIIREYDLSPYLDGVLKTFSIPATWRILTVESSVFPWAFRNVVDYTYTPQTITFTSEITAGTTLAAGQTLKIVYVTN